MIELPPNKNQAEQENKRKAFNDLFEQVLQTKGEQVPTIEYNLSYPKEDFLKFLVAEKNVLLHGSSTKNMETLKPRQANDKAKASGNKNAVYGVIDPVLPIFYAIKDRRKLNGVIESGFTENLETGEREYKFRIPHNILETKPWIRGMVYIFDKNQFHQEQDDSGGLSSEWTLEASVKPLAKLEVGPEDFRFLDKVEGN
ncbi:MAG: hypothetical protein Q8R55_02185 [Candidatus Taylorbacteria bacterium]|nr:hypothetical protein [Candidatus Taylorbacteria bacterium]